MKAGDVVAGRFTIERPAGYGAMGAVYLAKDRLTNGAVALKVLHREGSKRNQRFEREANLLAALRHPGVVRYVLHGATAGGAPFLAMEWIDGETLSDRISEGALSVEDAITVTSQLASALAEAHDHGVVHRDLKPGNVLLVGGDVSRIKLIDFGIARRPESELTLTGVAIGSPGYMAPEQARGEKDLGPRADVFSLGCVLYRCLVGSPPFAGSDVRSVLAKILFEEPPALAEAAPHVPAPLAALVGRMLAKLPADRPADGAAVYAELEAVGPRGEGRAAGEGGASLTSAEQRLMSVVAAITPGGTSDGPDPFDEPTTISPTGTPLVEAVSRTAAAFQAQVVRLADGTLLTTLSGQGNAGDQAAQAARCALAIRAAAPRLAIVVTTGRGLLGDGAPTGDVVDRAGQLLAALDGNASGVVELDDVTAALLEGRFEVLRRGGRPALLRDLGPLEGARTLLGKPTPCVGRDREIAVLEAAYAGALAESSARAVLVTGPAGVGKSRLRAEFVARLTARREGVALWVARGDVLMTGSPFAMIGAAMRRALGVFEAADVEEQRRRVAQVLKETLNPPDRRRVAEFVGELLGLPPPEDASVELQAARANPGVLGDQIVRAFIDFLAAKCAERPQLLVLEDLHWADQPSLNLVDVALRELAFAPLIVVALARPTVRDSFPNLWDGRPVEELRLGPLTKAGAEELARAVLGPRARRDVIDGVVERAGGNAFYLEELLRAVVEGRGDALPDSVLAMVESRLERLEPEDRHVLRAASVFGHVFWTHGVVALLGGHHDRAAVSSRLAELEGRELVTERDSARFPGETEFAFRHALVRDAAYSTLTEEDRALGHRLAATWLRRVGERDAGTLAEHLLRGGERQGAVEWYVLGAEQALESNDLDTAIARADRGIGCGAVGEALGALHLARADAYRWRAHNEEAEASSALAMSEIETGAPRWYAAAALLSASALRRGHGDRIAEVGHALALAAPNDASAAARSRALGQVAADLLAAGHSAAADPLFRELDHVTARHVPDPAVRGAVDEARAMRALFAGDVGRCLVITRSTAAAFDAAGDRRRACHARVRLGFASLDLGMVDEARRTFDVGVDAASALGLPHVVALARAGRALALAHAGDVDAARSAAFEAMRAFGQQGDVRMEGTVRTYLALVLMRAGDAIGAEREARAATLALATSPPRCAFASAVLSRALLARGDAKGSLAAAEAAMALIEALGGIDEGDALARLAHAEALVENGRPPRAALEAAARRLRERAARIDLSDLRQPFLERVPENARTLELAATFSSK